MKARFGFTLVELLVVIAIMGILTVISVSQFQTAKKKANDVARKGDLNAVNKALLMYFADHGVLPLATSDGKINVGTTANTIVKDWGQPFTDSTDYLYMKELPVEKKFATIAPFCYQVDADRKKFALFARLENEADQQCDRSGDNKGDFTYKCSNITAYCYASVGPNTSLNEDGSFK